MADLPLLSLAQAVLALKEGGLLAYPTEAVYGLGCLPLEGTVKRLLLLKERPIEKGLILVAATLEQLLPFVALEKIEKTRLTEMLATWPGPHTWVVPASSTTPVWLTGKYTSIAVRVSAHPVIQALAQAVGMPLISTSANQTGEPPLRELKPLLQKFAGKVDGVVEGDLGGLVRPTIIQDAITGQILRA